MAAAARAAKRRKAFGAIWLPGTMSTRGLAGAKAALPATSSLPTLPRLKPERILSCFLRRGTRPPENSTDTGWRSASVPRALAGTLPGPVVRLPGRRQGSRGEQGDARLGDTRSTLTRPLLPAVVQMCRTFQKSPVNRVVRPCRDSMPGTLVGVEVQDVSEDDTGVAET